MRVFNKKEKEVLNILDKSNGLKFQTLFIDKLHDIKITIDFDANDICFRYLTKNYQPDKAELLVIEKQSNELFERIYLTVTLVNFFEKEGYISLYRKQNKGNKIIVGNNDISDGGVINLIEDETIKSLLLEYTDKHLILSSEFNEFVKNGFISKDDLRNNKTIRLAWYGVIVAIFTSIASSFFSLKSFNDKSIENFNNDFNKYNIKQELILNHIDKMISTIKKENELVDSLKKKK